MGIRFGLVWQEQFRYSYMEIADQLQQDDLGSLSFGEQDASYWLNGYAWAMVLDDDGEVIWEYQLPQELDRRYTAPEIAVFSRWYLDDYPVFCQVRDYGLLVLGMPRDSIWKYSFWTYPELINWLFYRGTTVMGGVLVLILVLCLLFSWRGAKSLGVVADGLDTLAEGGTVNLSTKGFAGELAEKLNRTSAQIRSRNEIIQRRDTARTNWIAGVSHDIRTPLSLILGWAEQLQKNDALPEETRRKAEGICQQSEENSGTGGRSQSDQQTAIWCAAPAAERGACRPVAASDGGRLLQWPIGRRQRGGTGNLPGGRNRHPSGGRGLVGTRRREYPGQQRAAQSGHRAMPG